MARYVRVTHSRRATHFPTPRTAATRWLRSSRSIAAPANLAWCDPDARALAITAKDTVYRVRLKVAGIMPPFMPRPAG